MKNARWRVEALLFVFASSIPLFYARAYAQESTENFEGVEKPNIEVFYSQARVSVGFGTFNYEDLSGNRRNPLLIGAQFDWNFLKQFKSQNKNLFFGLSSGVQAASVDNTGTSTGASGNTGNIDTSSSALTMVPVRIEIGGSPLFSEKLYTGLALGTTILFIGDQAAINTGRDNQGTEVFPTLGGNIAYAITQRIGVMIRADFTPTAGDDILTGLAGFQLGIG
jgi:hypothetical protein